MATTVGPKALTVCMGCHAKQSSTRNKNPCTTERSSAPFAPCTQRHGARSTNSPRAKKSHQATRAYLHPGHAYALHDRIVTQPLWC